MAQAAWSVEVVSQASLLSPHKDGVALCSVKEASTMLEELQFATAAVAISVARDIQGKRKIVDIPVMRDGRILIRRRFLIQLDGH